MNRLTRCMLWLASVLGGSLLSATVAATDFVFQFGNGFSDNTSVSPVGGNAGTTLGEQRRIVFQAAAAQWVARVNSNVDIVMAANFNPLECSARSAVLGSAGPEFVFRNFSGAPQFNTFYVSALSNALAGVDLAPGVADLSAEFNASINGNPNCLASYTWYLGLDGNAGPGQIDLFDVVLHEIGHGLGFLSLVAPDGSKLGGLNDVFMTFLRDRSQNRNWTQMNDSQRASSSINTGNLVWTGANVAAADDHLTTGKSGGQVRMYAPNPFEGGSSVSHFDTALSPNALMEPSRTQFFPNVPDLTTALMQDLGWPVVTNTPPVAQNGAINTDFETPVSATLSATDDDGDTLTYSVVQQPSLGAVTITDTNSGAYTYIPNAGVFGSDSFTFKVNDGQIDSAAATVSVTIFEQDSDNDGTPNSLDLDDDNDGISDADEIIYGFNPLDPTDAGQDADGDGLTNLEEIQQGADPNYLRGDMNNDGTVDAGDVYLVQQIALALRAATSNQLLPGHGDVNLNGVIDAGDVAVIEKIALGLGNQD